MATETVAYELKITGNLESNARAAARAIENLGNEAEETKREVHEMGETFDRVGGIGEKVGSLLGGVWGDLADVTLDLGQKISGLAATLGPFGAAATAAAGATAIATTAVVLLSNAALEAKGRLDDVGVALDTPRLDAYAAATDSLSTSVDRLTVAMGEAVAGPLTGFVNLLADGATNAAALASAIDRAYSKLPRGGYGSSVMALGLGMADYWQNSGPVYGPAWDGSGPGGPSKTIQIAPLSTPTGRTGSAIASPGDDAWAAYQRGQAGYSGGAVALPPSTMDQFRAETDALVDQKRKYWSPQATGALTAAASGGGLSSVLGAFGPIGGLVGALATPDLAKNLTGVVDQIEPLIDALPEIITGVLTDFLPHLITSLDDIILSAVEAILVGLPRSLAAALGVGGGEPKLVREHKVTREQYRTLTNLQSSDFLTLQSLSTLQSQAEGSS